MSSTPSQVTARILVIHDRTGKAFLSVPTALRRAGYQVIEATSGHDALSLLRVHAFDLVMMQLRMPGVDGLDLLREVLSLAPDMPVIVLTNCASLSIAIEALRLGASDYLFNRTSARDIRDHVARVLHRPLRALSQDNAL